MSATATACCVNTSLHHAVQCRGWDECPSVASAHGQRLDTLVRGGQLGSAASRDAAAVTTTTHLPLCLGSQDRGTIQWDSNVQLRQFHLQIQNESISSETLATGKGRALQQPKAATFFIIFSHFSQSIVSQAVGID